MTGSRQSAAAVAPNSGPNVCDPMSKGALDSDLNQ
jgi:hypothetical protein